MKITEQDKQVLRDFGHPESDMRQLCEAARRCKYENDKSHKALKAEQVIEMIGRRAWLAGISRAAYHFTSAQSENGHYISFDCSAMFK